MIRIILNMGLIILGVTFFNGCSWSNMTRSDDVHKEEINRWIEQNKWPNQCTQDTDKHK